MDVVLDKKTAHELARAAIERRGSDVLAAAVVIAPGGGLLGSAHTANPCEHQMARVAVVREFAMQAITDGKDLGGTPKDWAERQPTPVGAAPVLTGAAVLIFSAKADNQKRYGCVGAIGLLGIDDQRTYDILRQLVAERGFGLYDAADGEGG